MRTLLEIENLRIRFRDARGGVEAVRGLDLAMGREKLALIGESGSGKSSVGRAILRVLPENAEMTARRVAFDGIDLLAAPAAAMRRLRGRRLAMILQDPRFSLNPVMTAGAQIAEVFRVQEGLPRRRAGERALAALEAVRIRDPDRAARLYPHELSGGMGQRVMIAMMLAARPDLLVADEPTSALDVTVQREVLALLDELATSRGMGLLFISHDLRLVAAFCERIAVMAEGRIVETLAAADLAAARHPYTRRLFAATPRLDA